MVRPLAFALLVLGVAAAVLLLARARPQDAPWTPLDPAAPIGAFTGRKLTAYAQAPARCRALLTSAGVAFTRLPPRHEGPVCGYDDGVRLGAGGAAEIAFAPPLAASCSVAAALAIWEWEVVQPAAIRHFRATVRRIDTFGTYACRRIAGSRTNGWSEHAHARAVDIAGFTLADGRRVTIARDWQARDGKASNGQAGDGHAARDAAFLHEVRDGACRLFATVLSPDFNAAHRDHLHLDQAPRGIAGWRACR